MTAKRTGRAKAAQATGHARLQAALVLRDALARELGLDLGKAMRALADVEDAAGAAAGLTEGRYLAALAAVCEGNPLTLAVLHDDLSRACGLARFSPRYAQYLALLLFAHWARARQDNPAAFLVRLNAHRQSHPASRAGVPAFTAADLQPAAFWMATAAGNTYLLHAGLALLERRTAWYQMIIITPTEALTRQHAGKLRGLTAWNVFAYPLDGDAFALGQQPPGTVIVLDINKLAVEKKGDGVTVPVSVFAGGRNLVCVDEGRKGQKAEASAWKAIQGTLAGIGPGTPHAERGLLIEFSATFGQVVEAEHSFDRYAKAVVFDYAYERFHRDRYGKDFWYTRLQTSQDAEAAAYRQTLTAALLAYWHQVSCYRALKEQPAAAHENLRIEAPLWVLLGLSVIGGSANQGDKDQTSDVVNVLAWLAEALSSPERLAGSLRQVLAAPALGQADGATLLPPAVRQRATGMAIEALSARVLADCFGW